MSYELGKLAHPHRRGANLMPKAPRSRVFAESTKLRSPFLALRVHQFAAVQAPFQFRPPVPNAPVIRRPDFTTMPYRPGVRPTILDPVSMYPVSMYPDGLGFSLKPPKAIRKAATAIKKAVTLKNVLKVGAIVAATALIPGALPLVAKTALGAGKLALGAGKLGAKGVTAVARYGLRNVTKAGRILRGSPGAPGTPPIVEPPADMPGQVPAPSQPSPPAPLEPAAPTVVPSYGGGGGGGYGGGYTEDMTTAAVDEDGAPKPAQAGIGGGAVAAIAVGAFLLMAASRPRR